jgi:hypothetical protein
LKWFPMNLNFLDILLTHGIMTMPLYCICRTVASQWLHYGVNKFSKHILIVVFWAMRTCSLIGGYHWFWRNLLPPFSG